jgi:hypothetical protein
VAVLLERPTLGTETRCEDETVGEQLKSLGRGRRCAADDCADRSEVSVILPSAATRIGLTRGGEGFASLSQLEVPGRDRGGTVSGDTLRREARRCLRLARRSNNALHDRTLDLATLGVGGGDDDKDGARGCCGTGEKRCKRVDPEVGGDGDRVSADRALLAEEAIGVASVGRGDVTPFRVHQHEAACGAKGASELLEDAEPCRTEALEEGRLGFYDSEVLSCGLHDRLTETLQAIRVVGKTPGLEDLRLRVDPETERAAKLSKVREALGKGGRSVQIVQGVILWLR